MHHTQVLLTNARQASVGGSSSSSASSTDEDTAQHAKHDDPKACASNQADVTSSTAARPEAAADSEALSPAAHASEAITRAITSSITSPNTSAITSATTSASKRAVPSQATLPTHPAVGHAVTPAVASTEAGTTAGSRSQSATYVHSQPGRAQQTVNYVCDKLQHGWRTVKSWLPEQLQKQLQSIMQPVLWGGVTEAANKCTGQGIAAQPWCRLDSWLTAPAEVQYQRYMLFHSRQR